MKHKLVRADGTTEVARIKSFHFHDQLTKDGDVRMGNVISASIEVEYYTSQTGAISKGEVLTYYQVFDYDEDFNPIQTEAETKIGVFTVYSSKITKTTCRLVLYDEISKLDIDYSPRLKAIQSSFPMTISALVADAASYAGVTTNLAQESNPHPKNYLINKFYSDSITVRDIFAYVAEIYGGDLHANYNGEITLRSYVRGGHSNYFTTSYFYLITPTPNQLHPIPDLGRNYTNVFYKQDGLQLKDYQVHLIDCVNLYKTDGTLVLSYSPSGTDDYVYSIKGNLLINYMDADNLSAWANTMCQRHYTYLREITNHVPYSASLFTFRCPYMVGGFASLLESDGTTISQVPIMSVDWTDEAVTVESFGNNATDYEYTQQRTADDTASIQAAQINELYNKLGQKVDTSLIPFPVEDGGTGQTGINSTSVVGNIFASTASGTTVSEAQFYKWGKLAQMRIKFKRTASLSSTASLVGVLNTGYKPVNTIRLGSSNGAINGYITQGGELYVSGTLAANTDAIITVAYLLA